MMEQIEQYQQATKFDQNKSTFSQIVINSTTHYVENET